MRSALERTGGEDVHGWRSDELGHEHRRGAVVHLLGAPHLFDDSVAHHRDSGSHGHGFHLIVCHVHEGGLESRMQRHDLGAGFGPQLGVQVGERFVHAEHRGSTHNGAGQRHPLTLSAGEGARLAVEIGGQTEGCGRGFGGRRALGLVDTAHLQRELDVRAHRLVRIEGVTLEDHGHVTIFRKHVVHQTITDEHLSRGGILETGDRAQKRGLPAPRRSEQDHELAVGDIERDLVHRLDVSEVFGHTDQSNGSHDATVVRVVEHAANNAVFPVTSSANIGFSVPGEPRPWWCRRRIRPRRR